MWVPDVPLNGLGSTVREEPPAKSGAEEVRSGVSAAGSQATPCARAMSQVAKDVVDSP